MNNQQKSGAAGLLPGEAGTSSAWRRGLTPVWRNLISPQPGQKALVLGAAPKDVLRMLGDSGVQVERSASVNGPVETGRFDLILEERSGWRDAKLTPAQAPQLSEQGRWVVALRGAPTIGARQWWIRRQLKRRGFTRVESFYAHPTLWSPVVLVPLDRREPFEYFLRLTVAGTSARRRAILAAFWILIRLRIHAGFLPNCIVVARRFP